MNFSRLQMPDGLRDYTGDEAYLKREIEAVARSVFRNAGFYEIETPCIEYSEVFGGEIGSKKQDKMIRFFDKNGRQLALRPDCTMPAARVVTARENELPLPARVFYVGNAYGRDHDFNLQQREYTQAGAELMGAKGVTCDASMVLLAGSLMKNIGIENCKIDIGNVGLFLALAKEAGLDEWKTDVLREILDTKNVPEAELYLEQNGVNYKTAQKILLLAEMYGGQEVIGYAVKKLENQECRKILLDLEKTCELAEESIGITVDLGLLPNIDYYTGIVFRGMAQGVGYPVLSGGRYDNVLAGFGRPMPAIGFAMGISRAMAALIKQGRVLRQDAPDVIAAAEKGLEKKLFDFLEEKRRQGKTAICSFAQDENELNIEKQQTGAKQAVFIKGGEA